MAFLKNKYTLSSLSLSLLAMCVYVCFYGYWVWFTFLNIFPFITGTVCRLLPGRNMFKQVIWTSLDVGSGLFQCSIQICLLQGHFSNFYYIVAVLSLSFHVSLQNIFDVHKYEVTQAYNKRYCKCQNSWFKICIIVLYPS